MNHVECVSMCVGGQAGALSFAERAELFKQRILKNVESEMADRNGSGQC